MLRAIQSWSDEMKVTMEFDYDEGEAVSFAVKKKKVMHLRDAKK